MGYCVTFPGAFSSSHGRNHQGDLWPPAGLAGKCFPRSCLLIQALTQTQSLSRPFLTAALGSSHTCCSIQAIQWPCCCWGRAPLHTAAVWLTVSKHFPIPLLPLPVLLSREMIATSCSRASPWSRHSRQGHPLSRELREMGTAPAMGLELRHSWVQEWQLARGGQGQAEGDRKVLASPGFSASALRTTSCCELWGVKFLSGLCSLTPGEGFLGS